MEGLRQIREEKARENNGVRGQRGPVVCKQAPAQYCCLFVSCA